MSQIHFRNEAERFIYQSDLSWFERYREYIDPNSRALKLGAGLGFSSQFLSDFLGDKLSVVETTNALHPDIRIPLIIYDGKKLPFLDNTFEIAILSYILHHCPDPWVILQEVIRVTKNRFIVIEDAWENFLQRLSMIYHCWLMNKKTSDSIKIRPKSLLSYRQWLRLFADNNLKIINDFVEQRTWRQRGIPYKVHLFLLEKS